MFLTIRNLWKKYPGTWALQGINLQAKQGSVLGIFGENGSGKSTLFRILAGVSSLTKGEVTINELPLGLQTRKITAYLPEVNHYYPDMKIGELFRFLEQLYPGWDIEKNRELLKLMRLEVNRKVGELSKGQKARLGIVCSFSWPAKMLLLDEPLGAIDPLSRKKIIQALTGEFRSEGQTIVISTHILSELEEIFDHVVYLNQGKIIVSGETKQLRELYGPTLTDIFANILEEDQE